MLLQPTGWQGSLNVKLWAQGLECSVFAVGEQKETKVWGKGSSCLRLPDALLLCGQELLETHSETCTIQMLCAGGNRFLWAVGGGNTFCKNQENEPLWHQKEESLLPEMPLQSFLLTVLHHGGWQRKICLGPHPLSQSGLQRMTFELRGKKMMMDTIHDEQMREWRVWTWEEKKSRAAGYEKLTSELSIPSAHV